MSLTIKKTEAAQEGRFYDDEGQVIPGDLRAARKLKGKPSVTTVLKVLANPQLGTWKIERALKVAAGTPMQPGETLEAWAKRVAGLADSQREAADLGTAVHKFAEDFAGGLNPAPVPGFEAVCRKLAEWITDNLGPGISEASLVNLEHGYAGRIDWIGELRDGSMAVIDFKTYNNKNLDLGPGYVPYLDYLAQLAAYSEGKPEYKLINVMISTNPKAPVVYAYTWTPEEAAQGVENVQGVLGDLENTKGL